MGGTHSFFSEEDLQTYKEVTYLTKKEILHVFNRFYNVDPDSIKKDRNVRIPADDIIKHFAELQHNPFADRMLKTFSSERDGCLSFDDFLDMISVLSDSTPVRRKAAYAFKIYDFDEDGLLGLDDLKELVTRLTGDKLSDQEKDILIEMILKESDLDQDGNLSFQEFEHTIMKCSDFMRSFRLQL